MADLDKVTSKAKVSRTNAKVGAKNADLARKQREEAEAKEKECVERVRFLPYHRYLTYLITKRYGYTQVLEEMCTAGFVAPSRADFVIYARFILTPFCKVFPAAAKVYGDYVKTVHELKEFIPYQFRHTAPPTQKATVGTLGRKDFLSFLYSLDVICFWEMEIRSASTNFKQLGEGPDGKWFDYDACGAVEDLLTFKHRTTVDQLILEGARPENISRYLYDSYGETVTELDIERYRKAVFDIDSTDLDKISDFIQSEVSRIEDEQQHINSMTLFSIGRRAVMVQALTDRHEFLSKFLNRVTEKFEDNEKLEAVEERPGFDAMLEHMMYKSFTRFKRLDQSTDPGAVKHLSEAMKMVVTAGKELLSYRDMVKRGEQGPEENLRVEDLLLKFYQESYDSHTMELKARAGLVSDDSVRSEIEGIDEV